MHTFLLHLNHNFQSQNRLVAPKSVASSPPPSNSHPPTKSPPPSNSPHMLHLSGLLHEACKTIAANLIGF